MGETELEAMGMRGSGGDEGEHPVVGLERAALARWCRGDPSGFLEIAADDVTYFDPFLARRIDGLAALVAYYETLRGRISAQTWEVIEPRVTEVGDGVVLSFRFVSRGRGGEMAWNATEVYRRQAEGWRIVHTHWAFTAAGAG